MTRLKAVVSNVTARAPGLDMPYVALEHIEKEMGRLLPAVELPEGTSADAIAHEPGDVRFGKLRPYLSKTYLADAPGVGSSELLVLRPGPEVLSKFLYYITLSRPFVQWAVATSQGVKMPRTSWRALREFDVELPEMDEQRRLCALLDERTAQIDDLIAEQERLSSLSRERVWVELSGLVGCRLTGDRGALESGLIEVPARWRVVQLREVASIQSGLTLGKKYDDALEAYPYLRVANVQDGRIDLEEVIEVAVPPRVAERHMLRTGDVLMTEGGDNDKLGRGAVWDGSINPCLHQNHIFAVRPTSALLPAYLAAVLASSWGRAYFTATAHQTTNLASTNRTKVGRLPILLPPRDVQDAIVAQLDKDAVTLLALSGEIDQQVRLLREHRQALITAAVTGQLEVV